MDAPPIQDARTEDGVNIAWWGMGTGYPLLGLYATGDARAPANKVVRPVVSQNLWCR